MKSLALVLAFAGLSTLSAEDVRSYRLRKAFEAGQESGQIQIDAIRECAVGKIQACVYPLIAHLKTQGAENATLRRESANALGHLKASEARESLLKLLSEEKDLHAKAAVIQALGLIGNKEDIKTISPYLGDSETLLRRRAARALFDMDDRSASEAVSGKIAGEKDDLTRVEMLNTALRFEGGKVEHVIELSKILLSSDRSARLRAAEVLESCRNKEVLTDLERAHAIEPDSEVRQALARAISATQFAN